jgi:type IV conjugative transfer system protein TraE
MSEQKSPQYLDVVANAFKTTQAWRFASFTLAGVVAVLLYTVVYQSRNTPVVLVPFELATQGKSMSVSVNGELRGTSFEYMANTGLSDLTLILNFTPDNVVSQHLRFLNRVTEELYGQQRESLLAQAEEFKGRAASQSFYPTSIKVNPDSNQVEIAGTQIRWVGSRESVRSAVTYIVTYSVFKGYLHVSDLRQKGQNVSN